MYEASKSTNVQTNSKLELFQANFRKFSDRICKISE